MRKAELTYIQEQIRHVEAIVRDLRLTELILASGPGEFRRKAMALLPFQEAIRRTDSPAVEVQQLKLHFAADPEQLELTLPADATASPASE